MRPTPGRGWLDDRSHRDRTNRDPLLQSVVRSTSSSLEIVEVDEARHLRRRPAHTTVRLRVSTQAQRIDEHHIALSQPWLRSESVACRQGRVRRRCHRGGRWRAVRRRRSSLRCRTTARWSACGTGCSGRGHQHREQVDVSPGVGLALAECRNPEHLPCAVTPDAQRDQIRDERRIADQSEFMRHGPCRTPHRLWRTDRW